MKRRRKTPQDLMETLLNSRLTPVPLPGREGEPGQLSGVEVVPQTHPAERRAASPVPATEDGGVAARPQPWDDLLLGSAPTVAEEPSPEAAPAEEGGDGWALPPAADAPSALEGGGDGHAAMAEEALPSPSEGEAPAPDRWFPGGEGQPAGNGQGSPLPSTAPSDDARAKEWGAGYPSSASADWAVADLQAGPSAPGGVDWPSAAPAPAELAPAPPIWPEQKEPPAKRTAADEPEYDEGLIHLQRGDWDAAKACFMALRERYPDDETLASLIRETELRTTLEKERPRVSLWRRLARLRRWTRRLLVATVIVGALLTIRQFYFQQIVPQQQQRIAEAKQTALMDEARAALARGDFDRAQSVFQSILAENPDDARAAAGLAEAQRQAALLADYQRAVSLEGEGRFEEALALYRSIRERAPVYRDVAQRISQLERLRQIDETYAEAEAYFQAERWAEAIAAYEKVRKLDGRYQRETIQDRLFTCYLELGKSLVANRPDSPQRLREAITAFNSALTLRPREEEATREREFARKYLDALVPYEAQNWTEAIALLRPIYDQRPDYLGGLVAEQLYHAYLALGDSYRAGGDFQKAWETYDQAAGLGLDNLSEAEAKRREVALLLTPTATPTPTSTPTVTPTPEPSATATPEPTKQLPLKRYRGRIAFWSDRDGGRSLWIMNPDGTNAFRYNNPDEIDELREREAYNKEGTWFAFVDDDGQGNKQIFYLRLDVPETWQRRFQVTFTKGVHYDPVWSPKGDRIAYVSNEVDGDEIWIIHPDGTDARRLTHNTWEWDKMPSWSPDGSQIVFWSNREGGRKQIFRMNADGSQQVNISRNQFNDWDPLWIK
jgi:tetratricopeptide (TPR) repeat protein